MKVDVEITVASDNVDDMWLIKAIILEALIAHDDGTLQLSFGQNKVPNTDISIGGQVHVQGIHNKNEKVKPNIFPDAHPYPDPDPEDFTDWRNFLDK